MAFINESISAETKASFDFTVFRGMFGERFYKFEDWQLRHWAVDIERNARFLYLESAGGANVGAERVNRYALWVNGDIAYLESEDKTEWDRVSPPIISWSNLRVILPKALHLQADATVAMILEAVHAIGWGFSTDLSPRIIIIGQPTVILTTEF